MHVTSGGSASNALKGKGATKKENQKKTQSSTSNKSPLSSLAGQGATRR